MVEIEAYIDNNFAGSGLLNFDEGYFESISIKDQYRRQYAKQYAPKTGNVMKVKLHIKNPFYAPVSRIDEIENMSDKSVRIWKNKLISQGYDGVIFGKGTNTEEHVCFDASCIEVLKPLTESIDESYGYWISPTGELHSVHYEGHDSVIYAIANCDYENAISMGWIRTVNNQKSLHAEFNYKAVSLRSILRLKAMGRGKSKFYIDYNEGDPDDMISEEFSSEREFNRAIRQAVTKN